MAKMQKKNEPSERITISKIYETIKAREFLQELWWDLISDIPNKPSYQRIKEMVKAVINDTMNEFSVEPPSEAEQVKRRTMLTEISIMTYTVDTVMSEVLFKKLQYEFPRLIQNMIVDLKRENQIPANTLIDASSTMTGNSFSSKMNNCEANGDQQSARNVLPSKQKSPQKNVANDERMNYSHTRKRGRPKKQRSEHPATSVKDNASVQPFRKRGRPPKRRSSDSNLQGLVTIKSVKAEDAAKNSDIESDVSVGRISDTISSVHTSELSSFEDTISICSGDENGRKRKTVPLKLANEMYLHGKLSEIYEIGKKEKPKLPAVLTKSTTQKRSPSVDSSPSARKPPQRIRKPNSKYNPDTMYCEVKDYSSPQTSTIFMSPQNDSTFIESPQKPKRQKISHNNEKPENSTSFGSSPVIQSTEVDSVSNYSPTSQNLMMVCSRTPKGSPSTRNASTINHSTPVKGSTKRYSPSDLYKPRSVIKNSVGSRGRAATSLFSD